jgi:hypothetical protein
LQMDNPEEVSLLVDREIGARVVTCHRLIWRLQERRSRPRLPGIRSAAG